jgi:hypothetical protein
MRVSSGCVGEQDCPNFWLSLMLPRETFAPSVQCASALMKEEQPCYLVCFTIVWFAVLLAFLHMNGFAQAS